MTGAIGAILAGVAIIMFYFLSKELLILVFSGGRGGSRDAAESIGIMLLIELVLLGVGGILAMVGYGGLQKVYGSTNIVGGIFALIAGLGALFVIVAGFARSAELGQIAMLVLFFGSALTFILGGIGQLSAGGLGKASGILNLLMGLLWGYLGTALFVPSLLQVFGSLDTVMLVFTIMLLGGGLAYVLTGVTMITARNA